MVSINYIRVVYIWSTSCAQFHATKAITSLLPKSKGGWKDKWSEKLWYACRWMNSLFTEVRIFPTHVTEISFLSLNCEVESRMIRIRSLRTKLPINFLIARLNNEGQLFIIIDALFFLRWMSSQYNWIFNSQRLKL